MTITQELIDAERAKFEASAELKYLDFSKTKDAWGKEIYFYTHVEAMWQGWQAAISHHKAVQDGYVLVPIEPTPEMVAAAFEGKVETQDLPSQMRRRAAMASDYKAMIAAAPSDNKALVESETVAYMDAQGVGTISVKMIKELESRGNVFPYEMWPIKLTATPADTVKQDAPKLCKWVEEDDENMPGTYSGTCGIMWSFTEGGVKENECKYCPSCGGVIEALQAK